MPRGTAHASPETRRLEILEAARRCFAERGYNETTVDAVASRSGLSKGAIYWHFRGKREIFRALFEAYLEQLIAQASLAGEAPTAEEALRRMWQAPLATPETVELGGAALEYMAQASRDEELRKRFTDVYAIFRDLIERHIRRGVEAGEFRPVDPVAVAVTLIAALDGLVLQFVFVADAIEPERIQAEGLELILRGLRK